MLPTTCKCLGLGPLCSKRARCSAAGCTHPPPMRLLSARPGTPVDSNMLAGCRFGRNPIVPTMVRTWQQRLLQCVKLPTHVVAPAYKPNIAIVNRPYDAGRGFLNLYEVAAHIEVSITACDLPQQQAAICSEPQSFVGPPCSWGLWLLLQLRAGHALLPQLNARCCSPHPQELPGRLGRSSLFPGCLTWMALSCSMCDMLMVRPASAAKFP